MEGSSNETRDEAFTILVINQPAKSGELTSNARWTQACGATYCPCIRLLRIITPEKFDDDGNPKPEALEKNEAILSAYGGSIIKQLGTVNIPCKYKEKKINCIFYITDTGPAILGLKACTTRKLVALHCTLKTNQLDQAEPTGNSNVSTQRSDISKRNPNYIESHVPLEERPPI